LQKPNLLDHLVDAHEHRHRHFEAERLGGLEVDHEFEFGPLLDRQIGQASPRAKSCRLTRRRAGIH
jgi:hypothetical protein